MAALVPMTQVNNRRYGEKTKGMKRIVASRSRDQSRIFDIVWAHFGLDETAGGQVGRGGDEQVEGSERGEWCG